MVILVVMNTFLWLTEFSFSRLKLDILYSATIDLARSV